MTYRYGLYLKSARGFYFTPDTKLMINGVECGYQASELSVVDPESGWIHTLWLNTDLTFTPEAMPTAIRSLRRIPTDCGRQGRCQARGQTRGQAGQTTATSKTFEKTTQTKKGDARLATTGDSVAMMRRCPGIAGATSCRWLRRNQAPQALGFGGGAYSSAFTKSQSVTPS